MRRRLLTLLVALLVCAQGAAVAETKLYVFTVDNPPEELSTSSYAVLEDETVITMTFAGDCTLGGESAKQGYYNSFRTRLEANGAAYPFAGLYSLFSTDDFTVVNLEGVFSDSNKDKVKKMFNFIGPTTNVDILTLGSVECVNMGNNHTHDFGARGFNDTAATLDAAGIGRFDENTICILEKDGVRIGMTATLFSLGQKKQHRLKAQMELLKELGCAAIIHTLHAGEEYRTAAGARQHRMAQMAADYGATLVVGHHPHVVQGVDVLGDVPVVYSLGNCSFGGNANPRDYDAALLRVELRFAQGVPKSLDWSIYPISQSSSQKVNDYQPTLLTGDDAARVMKKIADASPIEVLPYTDGEGAKQPTIVYNP